MAARVQQRVASVAVTRVDPQGGNTIDISLPHLQFYDIQNELRAEIVFTSIGGEANRGGGIGGKNFLFESAVTH
jgi:hypothetical protein